jgi:phosphoglycolate phosphatase-like HAD superfamily hydrolase
MNMTQQLIVFDMDGVLIDVSGSYRETVARTAALFLKPARGADRLPDPLFPLSDLAHVKQGGGLNNDWDLTCRVLELLFSRIGIPAFRRREGAWRTYESVISRCDVSLLSRLLTAGQRPLSELAQERPPAVDFVRLLYTGDVGSGNVIKQMFQEIYLGRTLFESTYATAPRVHTGGGLIDREALLVDPGLIERLAADHRLAIATGRPAAEAAYPLNRFAIRRFFETIYTLDDCLREEARLLAANGRRVNLSKPDPFMLDAIASQIPGVRRRWYVGDMPDDMIAAARSRAGFRSIGVLASAPDREALRKRLAEAGAHHIIDDLGRLAELMTGAGGSC